MADKKLESIKFPGLLDRYVVKPDIADVTGLQTALDGKADIEDVYNAFVTENLTGSIASFDDGADDIPVKSLVAEIVPVQSGSGDPSPSNVRPISGWNGCNVSVCGKNIFANDLYYIGFASQLWENGFTSKTVTKTDTGFKLTTDAGYGFGAYLGYFDSGVTFTVSFLNSGINAGQTFNIRKTTTKQLSQLSGLSAVRLVQEEIVSGANSLTFTTDEKCHYWLGLYDATSGAAHEQALTNVQLELGSTATEYEPYNGKTYSIDWTDEAGTVYGGSIDVTSGVLTVEREIVDLGSLTWSTESSVGYGLSNAVTNLKPVANSTDIADAYCTSYKLDSQTNVYGTVTDKTIAIATNSTIRIYDTGMIGKDGTQFKTAVAGVKLCYELETPTAVQLTPTEVKTLLGNNNVWADTGDIDLTYRADLGLYLDKIINA